MKKFFTALCILTLMLTGISTAQAQFTLREEVVLAGDMQGYLSQVQSTEQDVEVRITGARAYEKYEFYKKLYGGRKNGQVSSLEMFLGGEAATGVLYFKEDKNQRYGLRIFFEVE